MISFRYLDMIWNWTAIKPCLSKTRIKRTRLGLWMAYQNFTQYFYPIFLFLFFKIDRYQEYHVNRQRNERDDALKISELKNHSEKNKIKSWNR